MVQLKTTQVWETIQKEVFAVVGMVSAKNEAKTVGIMYAVRQQKLYFLTIRTAWKVKHIAQNPHISVTIPIAKRVAFMPWIKIPAATVTFSGFAQILEIDETPQDVILELFKDVTDDPLAKYPYVVIELDPRGDFITYGVGVSLMEMRDTQKARGRVSVKR